MIEFQSVSLEYPSNGHARENGQLALSGVDLAIAEGEFVCVIGPSGSGKTSLLNLLAGFLAPTSGSVLFRRIPVTGPSPERAVIFQDPTLFPWLNVRANVEFGLRCAGVQPDELSRRTLQALDLVGLSQFAGAYPRQLSGGMRQRAALARALVLDPSVLLMDEPFSALDENARERLQDELLRIWETHRRTTVFVTHNIQEAAYLADRVVVLGPPPNNVKGMIPLNLPRPRRRSPAAFQEIVNLLRLELDRLPCCLPANKKE